MNDVIWVVVSVFSLPIFLISGRLLGNALKARHLLKLSSAQRRDYPDTVKGIKRRKIESNPNIICGFPIHQKAREDAPFF